MSRESLTISRAVFEESIKGNRFHTWASLEAVVPDQESWLLATLALALVVLVNFSVWLFIFHTVARVSKAGSKHRGGWAALGLLCAYGAATQKLCHSWLAGPDVMMQTVSRVFFGIVPAITSVAAYVLGLLVVDSAAWHDSFGSAAFHTPGARLVGLLAVIPGLLHSLYLFCTLTTAFEAVGVAFDVLSLCVFVDVARAVAHVAFLVAPPYPLERRARSSSYHTFHTPSTEALISFYLHTATGLCVGWFALLSHWEASGLSDRLVGPARVKVLVALTSYLFLPSVWGLALSLSSRALPPKTWRTRRADCIFLGVLGAGMLALFAAGVFFDVPEPTVLGAVALLIIAFWSAYRLTDKESGPFRDPPTDGSLGFVSVLLGFAAVLGGSMVLVDSCSQWLRAVLRDAMAGHGPPVALGAAACLLVGSGFLGTLRAQGKGKKEN